MNHPRLHTIFALMLLTLALVASPVLAAPSQQCEVKPACGVTSSSAAQMADLLAPARSTTAVTLDLTSHYIGQCCTNNDASLCPAVAGYSTVHCSFPMCGSGLLSCVYSQ